jgi:hypothetical protein
LKVRIIATGLGARLGAIVTRQVVFLIVLWALLLVAAPGQVFANGFRCPSTDRIIDTGDSIAKVESDCGSPQSRTDVFGNACRKYGGCTKVKMGERWVYDFGSNYLVRYLFFANGLLTMIEEGGYGGKN